eukprot:scaffold1019_cov255-Pinguiococcus_pyrenoidosus.AAC.6
MANPYGKLKSLQGKESASQSFLSLRRWDGQKKRKSRVKRKGSGSVSFKQTPFDCDGRSSKPTSRSL